MAAKKTAAKKAPAKRPAAPPPDPNVQPDDTAQSIAAKSGDEPVTDDAGRPETHDNFGDPDTGEE
jgi:hypothetical protein